MYVGRGANYSSHLPTMCGSQLIIDDLAHLPPSPACTLFMLGCCSPCCCSVLFTKRGTRWICRTLHLFHKTLQHLMTPTSPPLPSMGVGVCWVHGVRRWNQTQPGGRAEVERVMASQSLHVFAFERRLLLGQIRFPLLLSLSVSLSLLSESQDAGP